MATIETRRPPVIVPRAAPEASRPRRFRLKLLLIFCLSLLLIAWVAISWSRGRGLLGFTKRGAELLTHVVQPIDLRITVLESGSVESASSVNVLSAVEGQTAIISLVSQGSRVQQGDVVMELDASALKTRRTEQQIAIERARAAYSEAKQAEQAARSQAESDVKAAELVLRFAGLDLKKYTEGEYPQLLLVVQNRIAQADDDLSRARDRLKHSEDLNKQGYLSKALLEADRSTAMRLERMLKQVKEDERVLREFSHTRTKEDLESKLVEADRHLSRIKSLVQAGIDQSAAKLRAQEATLQLEEDKLKHIEDQISKCVMRSTHDGVVVYPTPADNDQVELFIKQGTVVRERQHVFSITNTDVMQVSTSVHEAMVTRVKPGMTARVWIDVYPDMELYGKVEHVSSLPDTEDWRKSTVKFYQTKISINERAAELRPGMSAKVEILVDELKGVLAVPVQAVVQKGHTGFCYVTGSQPELRRLRLGKSNDQFIEVLQGLAANDHVVLSPDVLGVPADVLQNASADEAANKPTSKAAADGTQTPPKKYKGDKIQYKAELSGLPSATGEVELELTTLDGVTQKEFQVKIAGGSPGATWDVSVDGVVIGQVTLDAAGSVESEWQTEDGNFPESFPATAGPGSEIKIGDALSGKLALKPPKQRAAN